MDGSENVKNAATVADNNAQPPPKKDSERMDKSGGGNHAKKSAEKSAPITEKKEKDPLEAIPTNYLLDLLKILRQDLPDALYAEGLVKTLILWRKNKEIPEDHVVYAPFADFKYGACVSIFKTSFQAVSFYSQDPEDKRLLEALLTTKLVDWKSEFDNCVLDAVSEKVLPIVDRLIHEKQLEKQFSIKAAQFWMDKERALNLEVKFPDDVRLERLKADTAEYLDRYWPHKFEGSLEFMRTLLERNFGLGIFLPHGEVPVAWAVCSHSCCIAMLYTLETHRRRGFARILCNAMAKRLAEMDIDPRANVLAENQPSRMLFLTMGYREGSPVHFIGLKKKERVFF